MASQKVSRPIPRILIAGTHSGAGKTTVTLTVMAGLMRRGLRVQGFKAGPDFIDPSHHSAVTGRASRNLDSWMLPEPVLRDILHDAGGDADISVVEGVMGMHDGFSPVEDIGSSAHVAKLLDIPVILVVDAWGMARSAAAMVQGYANFDKGARVVGVVFNNVGSPHHYSLLKQALEAGGGGVRPLGYLPHSTKISIPERHLGLTPAQEGVLDKGRTEELGRLASGLDLDALMEIAADASPLEAPGTLYRGGTPGFLRGTAGPRVAVAWDKAFHFYYPDNLRLLEQAGAELSFFSPLADEALPAGTDVLYLGGGFPEVHAEALSQNEGMRRSIRRFVLEERKTTYAECGGLMYLCDGIRLKDGKEHRMSGIVPAVAVMADRFHAMGYVQAEVLSETILGRKGERLRGHEFHYSFLEPRPGFDALGYAYKLTNRLGAKDRPDGILIANCLASYCHLHFAAAPHLAKRLLRTPAGV